MNPKQYAKSRKLTLKQFNDLAKIVLQNVPPSLDDEQISKLDAALAAAAEQVAALPEAKEEAEEGETPDNNAISAPQEENNLAVASGASEATHTAQVIEVLGEDMLRRNIGIFLAHHVRSLQKIANTHKDILNKFEQEVYHETSQTFARMTRNMEAGFKDMERLTNPKTAEEEQVYQDYLQLVDEFLSPPNP